jgi:DNA adenine methylase
MADTLIKRVGGKVKIREWIKGLLPVHKLYCEPFGGSFAVGFAMPKPETTDYRLVYNDLDGHVWNFFRVLRDHRDEFLTAQVLTPYSRRELENAVVYIETKRDFLKENPVEWARNYLIYNRQSMFGKEDGTWCVSRTGENICMTWAKLPPLIETVAAFLRNVYLENLDYKECIRKWDCGPALFYLDPPYENVEKDFYHANKKDGFDHNGLADAAKQIQGSCAISYYDSDFIRKLYPESEGFKIYEKRVVKSMQRGDNKSKAQEILIVKKGDWAKQSEQGSCFPEENNGLSSSEDTEG